MGTDVAPAGRMLPRDEGGPGCRNATHEDGFSLVEVLVAAGVLVGGIVAVLQLFFIAAQATLDARDATYAAVLAAQKIEELRAEPFPAPGDTTEYLNGRGAQVLDRADSLYERRSTVVPLDIEPDDTVVLTVRVWRRGAAGRAVRLTTVHLRRGE